MVTNKVLRFGNAYDLVEFLTHKDGSVSVIVRNDDCSGTTTFEGEGDDGEDVEAYELNGQLNLGEVKDLIKFLQDFVDTVSE